MRIIFLILILLINHPISYADNEVFYKYYLLCDSKVTDVIAHPNFKKGDKLSNVLMYIELKRSYDLRRSVLVNDKQETKFTDFLFYALKPSGEKIKLNTSPYLMGTTRFDNQSNKWENISIGFGLERNFETVRFARLGGVTFSDNKWDYTQTWISKELKNNKIEEENYSYGGNCKTIDEKTYKSYL